MSKAGNSHLSNVVAIATLMFVASRIASAGEWRVRPNFSLNERYSDNINAAPTGLEESDFITTLSSGLLVNGKGRRVQLDASYSVQKSISANDSEFNNLTHFLSGDLRTELIEQFFFVDANATITPTVVSNSGRFSNRNFIDVGGNRADVISYTVSPRVEHHFGTWATATARTSFGDTQATQQGFGSGNFGSGNFNGSGGGGAFNGANNLAGSGGTNGYTMSLLSGRRFARSNWGVNYSERQFEADQTGQESTLKSLNFNAGYRLNRKIRLSGNIGDESNEFVGDQNLDNGMTWSIGADYSPSPRTSLTGNYGHRSFGATKNFTFSHRFRRANITGSYNEDLSTTAEQLQRQRLFQNLDVFGNPAATPFDPLNLANVQFPINNLSLTNDVFVSRSLNASIGYVYRLNAYNFGIFRTEQETLRTQGVEEVLGLNFSWSRPLGRQLSANFNVNWQDRSGDNQESNQGLFITQSLSYQLGQHISTSLSYSYSQNSSDLGTNDFVENSVFGSLSYAF